MSQRLLITALSALVFTHQALAPNEGSAQQAQDRAGDGRNVINLVLRMSADERKVVLTSEYWVTTLRLRNEYDRPILVNLSTPDPMPGGIGDSLRPKGKSGDVVIKPGETVLLGGLLAGEPLTVKTGPPVLNKIPILGQLFRRREVKDSQTELVILITPNIK